MSEDAVDAFLKDLRRLKQRVKERKFKANRMKAANGQTMGLSPVRPQRKPKKRISLYVRAANPTIYLATNEDQNADDQQKQCSGSDHSHKKRTLKQQQAKIEELFKQSMDKKCGAACRKYKSPKDIGTHARYPSAKTYVKPEGDETHDRLFEQSQKAHKERLEAVKKRQEIEDEELANMMQWKPILTGVVDEREEQRKSVNEAFENAGLGDVASAEQLGQVFQELHLPDRSSGNAWIERLWEMITLKGNEFNAKLCREFLSDCCSVIGGSEFHKAVRRLMFPERGQEEAEPELPKKKMHIEALDRLCQLPEPLPEVDLDYEPERKAASPKATKKIVTKPMVMSQETQELLEMGMKERQAKLDERREKRKKEMEMQYAPVVEKKKERNKQEAEERDQRVNAKKDQRWAQVLRETQFSFMPQFTKGYDVEAMRKPVEVRGYESSVERQRRARELTLKRRSLEKALKI